MLHEMDDSAMYVAQDKEDNRDIVYMVHRKCYEGGDLNFYNVYLYKNLNDAEKFIAENTGYTKQEVQGLLSVGDCIVKVNDFDYSIEEVEVM